MRWLISMLCVLLCNIVSAQPVVYEKPKIEYYRVDWCFKWNEQCGPPAAAAFCKSHGHSRAVDFAVDHDIGLTRVLSNQQVCRAPHCDGFKYIVCE